MTKPSQLTRLIEQEKLLYLEVEQLRYSLYLHDESILFQFLSAFSFAFSDILAFFSKKSNVKTPTLEQKRHAIQALLRKKNNYLALQRSPYSWIISSLRFVRRSFLIMQLRLHTQKPQINIPKRGHKKNTYVIFGSTESSDMQSRSAQIAHSLAKHHEVLYIEGVFDEGIRSGYRIVEESAQFKSVRLTAYKSFHLNYQKPASEEILLLKRSLKQVHSLIHSRVNPSFYIHHPFWDSLLSLKKKSFIFDRACAFVHYHNAAQHIIDAEKKLMKNALTVTAPYAKLTRNKKDKVIANGVDFELFKDTAKMIQTCDVGLCWIKKPVMGYIGTLDERIDEVLLGSIATAFPTASIVLVGNTDYRPVIEVAEKFPNIFPVGKQQYKKLPLFLQSFDILISPFKFNKNIPIIHPELALYLSSGKPIVAPPSPSQGANNLLYTAKTHTEWMIAIAEALKEKPRSKRKYLRIASAKKLNWKVNLQ